MQKAKVRKCKNIVLFQFFDGIKNVPNLLFQKLVIASSVRKILRLNTRLRPQKLAQVIYLVTGLLVLACSNSSAKTKLPQSIQPALASFSKVYQSRFDDLEICRSSYKNSFALCSEYLRNDGNGPFILHHGYKTKGVVVLFHGLSDSPFFMRSIASELSSQGYNVVVPLLPGHGVKEATEDMKDEQLAERWQEHVVEVMNLASLFGEKVYIGGFSTGGALSVQYYLAKPDAIDGIVLFSGALALPNNAESIAKIWGIKWLAKIIDGDYLTEGANPYKYPAVASFAGLELMDIIKDIRKQLEQGGKIKVPLFVAHSEADATTPIEGVEQLISHTDSDNIFFRIDEADALCHADLVVSWSMLRDMNFDKSKLDDPEEQCAIPTANPKFVKMISALESFMKFYAN